MTTALATRPKLRHPTILDAQGRPMRSASKPIDANPRGQETYNTHPAFDISLETLISYYRQAERGQPARQCDAFHDIIEVDPDLRSKINDRIESVAGCEFAVMAGRGDKPSELAAAALNERLQNQIQFRAFLAHQLTSVHYGYAATNLVWDFEDGVISPIQFVNPAARRFASPGPEQAHEIMLIDAGGEGMYGLLDLEPGLWAISRYQNILGRNPFAAGLMRSCSIWAMFKRWAVKGWQVFADMFGIPLALGYYEEYASQTSRDALEDAVRAIGQDGYAVISAATELVVKETVRGGDSSTVYPQLIRTCEEQIAKLLTGGTLNTDVAGVGSYNAAAVHETRGYTQKMYDAAMLQETFVQYIGLPFVVWNGYAPKAAAPRLKIKIRRDSLPWAQTLEIMGQVIGLDEDQIREDFGLRVPASGEGVKFEATPMPKPGDPAKSKAKDA